MLGIEPRKNLYTPWFEIDCSDPQERQAQEKLDSKVCVGQSGKSIVMAPRSSRSSVIFDLDNDGDLDIVTNDFNSEPQVLVSDLAQRKKIHWLKIVLEGTSSNRNGLGATVRVLRWRANLYQVQRRQVRLSRAECSAALLRARGGCQDRPSRSRLAVRAQASLDHRD